MSSIYTPLLKHTHLHMLLNMTGHEVPIPRLAYIDHKIACMLTRYTTVNSKTPFFRERRFVSLLTFCLRLPFWEASRSWICRVKVRLENRLFRILFTLGPSFFFMGLTGICFNPFAFRFEVCNSNPSIFSSVFHSSKQLTPGSVLNDIILSSNRYGISSQSENQKRF